ncbi:MAG: alkyl/aryl-sulfatase [Christensenellales bacterium]|jgi:alkyl sulfatase BDS1-like metallo-beta-lactamase superfamily hydrolase
MKRMIACLAIFALMATPYLPIALTQKTDVSAEPDLQPKLPTQHTVSYNLNFGDDNYFSGLAKEQEFATYGLIDRGDGKIRSMIDPKVVLIDLEEMYGFLNTDEYAGSVNPSLWEESRLNFNYGLYKVTDGIYQVRGYSIANVTFVETDNGWFVMDVSSSMECAKAAFDLVEKNLGVRPIYAISYSHTHTDHYSGAKIFVTEEQIADGSVRVFAPDGFMEKVASENIYVGAAMGRRAVYQFSAERPGQYGAVDSGLGKSIYGQTSTLIAPTDVIKVNQSVVVDGLEVQFQLTPGTEAPAEMNTYIPKYKTLFGAENVNGTLHNVYTLRGAEIRDALAWAKYIDEAIVSWPDMEYICSSHNWPRYGNETCITYLENHRDTYKFIHDRTLNLLNKGYTLNEVGRMVVLPSALEKEWTTHGYYGTVSHNARAVAQRYLGFYDSNPSNLNPLMQEDAAKKYVEYMGGAEAILRLAQADYDKGEYAWVAEVLNRVIFADPQNMEARALLADALEQLGYQAESAIWRNAYIQGATELRHGTPLASDYQFISVDIVSAMTLDLILDFLAIKYDGIKCQDDDFTFNVKLTDSLEQAHVMVRNSVINYRLADAENALPEADITISAAKLGFVKMLNTNALTDETQIEGDSEQFVSFLENTDTFTRDFGIVLP